MDPRSEVSSAQRSSRHWVPSEGGTVLHRRGARLRSIVTGSLATALGFLLLGIAECGGEVTPTPSTSGLQWYYTCGDPVCSGYSGSSTAPACTDQKEGAACSVDGAVCDPKDDCNRLMVCASEDPTQQPGGCPISEKRHKKDIQYLDATGLKAYRDELLGMKLATYQYQNAPAGAPERLGFLIDDQPMSKAVLPSRERVDLYGYTSMAVAALQVQAGELEALRADVAKLRAELADVQKKPGCR